MSRAAPPVKWAPPTTNRGRETESKIASRNYSELVDSATFPFRRDGFDREFIEHTGSVFLVARSKRDRQLHYEVVVLQKRKARILPNEHFLPEDWGYPASEQWERPDSHTTYSQKRGANT